MGWDLRGWGHAAESLQTPSNGSEGLGYGRGVDRARRFANAIGNIRAGKDRHRPQTGRGVADTCVREMHAIGPLLVKSCQNWQNFYHTSVEDRSLNIEN